MKVLLIMMMTLTVVACGKKDIRMEPANMGIVDSLSGKKDLTEEKIVNEQVCFADAIKKDVYFSGVNNNGIVEAAETSFCDGKIKFSLKVYKALNKEIRVYGIVEDIVSGKKSCLKNDKDYHRTLIFNQHQGTLVGDGVKIALGGHEYTTNGKLIPSAYHKLGYVKFDDTTFRGEIAYYEGNTRNCWGIY